MHTNTITNINTTNSIESEIKGGKCECKYKYKYKYKYEYKDKERGLMEMTAQ